MQSSFPVQDSPVLNMLKWTPVSWYHRQSRQKCRRLRTLCGANDTCAVFELNHVEPAVFPHPCAETSIRAETRICAVTPMITVFKPSHRCEIFVERSSRRVLKLGLLLRVCYLVGVPGSKQPGHTRVKSVCCFGHKRRSEAQGRSKIHQIEN